MDPMCQIGATIYLSSRCELLAATLFLANPSRADEDVGELAQFKSTAPTRSEKIWMILSPEDLSLFVQSGREVTVFADGVTVPACIDVTPDLYLMRGWIATGRDDCGPLGRLLQALHDRNWFMQTSDQRLETLYRTADFSSDALGALWPNFH